MLKKKYIYFGDSFTGAETEEESIEVFPNSLFHSLWIYGISIKLERINQNRKGYRERNVVEAPKNEILWAWNEYRDRLIPVWIETHLKISRNGRDKVYLKVAKLVKLFTKSEL